MTTIKTGQVEDKNSGVRRRLAKLDRIDPILWLWLMDTLSYRNGFRFPFVMQMMFGYLEGARRGRHVPLYIHLPGVGSPGWPWR